MQKLILSLLVSLSMLTAAQNPALIKTVSGTAMEPSGDDQKRWENNYWNGMFFYQGKGSPSKLCVTDGTNAGTKFVANLGNGGFHAVLPAKDFVYIITAELISFSPFTYKYEIWRTDGTAAGTSLIMTPPNAVGISNASSFFSDQNSVFNYSLDGTTNTLYFSAYDAVNGNELWVSDGTPTGTFMLKDIKPGTGGSYPWGFFKIGADVYFNCAETGLERKLWKTDGTAAGTVKINVPEPFFIVNGNVSKLGNKMIFWADNTVDGYEPYVSDGTAAGTFMLGNINPGGNSYLSTVQELTFKSNSKHCFMVLQNGTDTALWRTDGTSAGTIRLSAANLYHGTSSGGYSDVDENGIWFIQYNAAGLGNSENLYRSDGTPAGTYQVASNLSYAQKIKIYKKAAWFRSRDIGSVANTELWRSGGNAATTNKALEIEPAIVPVAPFTPYSSDPYGFFVNNNKLYFFAKKSLPSSAVNLYEYNGDFTFNGTSPSALWKDSANWNSMMPPGITDTVYIPAVTPYPMNVFQGNAYAGVLNLQGNLMATISTPTDTLFVNNAVISGSGTTPVFSGAGYLALRNNRNDTVHVYNGINTNGLLVNSNSILHNGNAGIGLYLTLKNARLVLGNNNLSMSVYGTMSGDSTSFVVTNGTGVVTMDDVGGTRTGPQSLFIGTGSNNYGYELQLENTGTSDQLRVRAADQIYSAYSGETPAGPAYGTGALNTTFFINENVPGGSNVNMLMKWFHPSQQLPGFDLNTVHLGHYTAGSWNLGTGGPAVVNGNSWSYSRTGITSFSPFGILNASAGTLPLQLLSFTVRKNQQQLLLNWKTADEQQVSHFDIQRSTDARNFITISTQPAFNQTINHYLFTDDVAGINQLKVYYRLRQTDRDGKQTYSAILPVSLNGQSLAVYPTVFNQHFRVQNNENYSLQLELFNAGGQLLLRRTLQPGTNEVTVNAVHKGVLSYRIAANGVLKQTGNLLQR